MYNWRIFSFFAFTSIFWFVSMASATVVWTALSSSIGPVTEPERLEDTPIKYEDDDTEDNTVKEESDDDVKLEHHYPEATGTGSAGPSRRPRQLRFRDEVGPEELKKEEEIEESTMIEPLRSELEAGRSTQSRFNTSDVEWNLQRRRAHSFGSSNESDDR